MVELIRRNLPKIKRYYHGVTNKKIEVLHDSAKVLRSWPLQEEQTLTMKNDLECQFYDCNKTTTYHFPEVRLYLLKDVYLVGKEAWPFLDLNQIFSPAIDGYDQKMDRIKRPVKLLAKEQPGTIFHLTGPNSGNKGHFLVEYLPRLMMSLKILEHFSSYDLMLIPERGKAHIPLLNKFDDLNPTEYVSADKGTIFCKNLIYAPLLTKERNLFAPPNVYLKIRDQVIKNTKIDKLEPLFLFLSRTDAPDRFLLNEAEIFDYLKNFWPNLKLIRLSELQLDEQINLFNNAKVVIGPHGQGFRNMLYARDCLSVQLQFGEHDAWCTAYSNIANTPGNLSITFYSGTKLDSKGNWFFPEELLKKQAKTLSSMLPYYFEG